MERLERPRSAPPDRLASPYRWTCGHRPSACASAERHRPRSESKQSRGRLSSATLANRLESESDLGPSAESDNLPAISQFDWPSPQHAESRHHRRNPNPSLERREQPSKLPLCDAPTKCGKPPSRHSSVPHRVRPSASLQLPSRIRSADEHSTTESDRPRTLMLGRVKCLEPRLESVRTFIRLQRGP